MLTRLKLDQLSNFCPFLDWILRLQELAGWLEQTCLKAVSPEHSLRTRLSSRCWRNRVDETSKDPASKQCTLQRRQKVNMLTSVSDRCYEQNKTDGGQL